MSSRWVVGFSSQVSGDSSSFTCIFFLYNWNLRTYMDYKSSRSLCTQTGFDDINTDYALLTQMCLLGYFVTLTFDLVYFCAHLVISWPWPLTLTAKIVCGSTIVNIPFMCRSVMMRTSFVMTEGQPCGRIYALQRHNYQWSCAHRS